MSLFCDFFYCQFLSTMQDEECYNIEGEMLTNFLIILSQKIHFQLEQIITKRK